MRARRGQRRAGLLCAAVLVLAGFFGPVRAQGDTTADAEIRALVSGLGQSGCRFQRNGRWHAASDAQAHLQRKYEWARKRGLTGDAEAFIDQAASRSSLSGRAYRVACPGQAEADAGDWFRMRLAALRASPAPR